MQPSNKQIFAYGSASQLAILGQFKEDINIGTENIRSVDYVLKGNHGSLLSCNTTHDLDLIDIKVNLAKSQRHVNDDLVLQFPKLFKDIGKLMDTEDQIHIDDTVHHAVAQQARQKQVSEELDNLKRQGILRK